MVSYQQKLETNEYDDVSSQYRQSLKNSNFFADGSSFEDMHSIRAKSEFSRKKGGEQHHMVKKPGNGIINHQTQTKDEYWEVLMDTKAGSEGLSGI